MSTEVSIVGAIGRALGTVHNPSDDERTLKARFWLKFRENPIIDSDDVTAALVAQLTGDESIHEYVKVKGFWAWFNVKDQVKENLEIAAERASELALAMLDPMYKCNDNARVQLVKYVLEFAGRAPATRKEVKWADKDINEMSSEQLDALISKMTARLNPAPPKD